MVVPVQVAGSVSFDDTFALLDENSRKQCTLLLPCHCVFFGTHRDYNKKGTA